MYPFRHLEKLLYCPACNNELQEVRVTYKCTNCKKESSQSFNNCCPNQSIGHFYKSCYKCKYEFHGPLSQMFSKEINEFNQLLKMQSFQPKQLHDITTIKKIIDLRLIDIFDMEIQPQPQSYNLSGHRIGCIQNNTHSTTMCGIDFKNCKTKCNSRESLYSTRSIYSPIDWTDSKSFSIAITCEIISMINNQQNISTVNDYIPGYVDRVKFYLMKNFNNSMDIDISESKEVLSEISSFMNTIPTKTELKANKKKYSMRMDDIKSVIERLNARVNIIRELHEKSTQSLGRMNNINHIYICESIIHTDVVKINDGLSNILKDLYESIKKSEAQLDIYNELYDNTHKMIQIHKWNEKIPGMVNHKIWIQKIPDTKSVESIKFTEQYKYETKLQKIEKTNKKQINDYQSKINKLSVEHNKCSSEIERLKKDHQIQLENITVKLTNAKIKGIKDAITKTEKRLLHNNNQIEGLKSLDDF